MSMTGRFVPISADRVPEVIARPGGPLDFLLPDDGTRSHPDALDVDKSWHAIHFLLTGEAWGGSPPLGNAVLGGTEVGEDMGYGPARLLTPPEVAEVAAALATLTPAVLVQRYGDGSRLTAAEIYPGGGRGWEMEDFGYIHGYFDQLAAFYRNAAGRGEAVLLYLV